MMETVDADNLDLSTNNYTFYDFHSTICQFCKGVKNVKICTQCKATAYCSREHQRLDWQDHKEFCKALSLVNKALDQSPVRLTTLESYVNRMTYKCSLLSTVMKRRLFYQEWQTIMFQRHCELCYSERASVNCTQCISVFYCCIEHKLRCQKKHQEVCGKYAIHRQLTMLFFNTPADRKFIIKEIPPQHHMMIPTRIEQYFEIPGQTTPPSPELLTYMKLSWFSMIASVIYSLQSADSSLKRRAKRNRLAIHFIGSNYFHNFKEFWRTSGELIFHWFQNVNDIHFLTNGLDINILEHHLMTNLCANCIRRKCLIKLSYYPPTFKDPLNALNHADLVVAFNNEIGYRFKEKWEKRLEYLVYYYNVPIILANSTLKSIQDDLSFIERFSTIKMVVQTHINPFSDPYPRRYYDDENLPFHYRASCIAVIKRIH